MSEKANLIEKNNEIKKRGGQRKSDARDIDAEAIAVIETPHTNIEEQSSSTANQVDSCSFKSVKLALKYKEDMAQLSLSAFKHHPSVACQCRISVVCYTKYQMNRFSFSIKRNENS